MKLPPLRPGVSLSVLLLATASAFTAHAAAPEKVRFNQHVRPILSNNCFYCHGPDDKHREAELRLDLRDGAIKDLGGHAAIVPGKPDESALIKRVTSVDDDERMPPPASKKPHLSAEQIAILRRWIEQGAEYEGHWAFLPLAEAKPPVVKNEAWTKNRLDRYILARLEEEGITPSPEAAREVLIRRVSLDLTGLLPSPDEVTAFVKDTDPKAYENLVDRLLKSPHYGERWGRHWLDQARYADSNGYSIDSERMMWPYRDWVIKALNDDLPFDRFTIEQLAGDLLPNPTKNQLVATAFHRNTLINEEGGTDREQFRHEAVVDRVNTTGAVWLGLTVGCAQCHTHKFDPISHREYYELFAFFNQTTDINNRGATVSVSRGEMLGTPAVTVPATPAVDPTELAKRQAAWEAKELAALEAAAKAPRPVWSPAKYLEYNTADGAGFELLDDNSLLSDGKAAAQDTYRIKFTTDLKQVAAVRLRVLIHDSLPKKGPGKASNGNFVLSEATLAAGKKELPFAKAKADHEQPGYAVGAAIDADQKTGWAINTTGNSAAQLNANHEALLTLHKPVAIGDEPLELKLFHEVNNGYLIGRFAIDVAEAPPANLTEQDELILAALRVKREERSEPQSLVVDTEFEKSQSPSRNPPPKPAVRDRVDVMVMKEVTQPRTTYIYLRGDFLRPDKGVGPLSPGVLKSVPPLPEAGALKSRLELARWLVEAKNPLTPRVAMNRVWLRYFGRGLVETEEDFGTQGSSPSHSDLLDYLASEFISQGWSQKAMHKLIVTSATYRQSSAARPDLREKDPRNLLLARQERIRAEAEVVRDAALAASGLLDRTIGGPSVRPPQPEGVYAFTQNSKPWTAETGTNRYRRAMYTMFYRSAPYPLFTTFDTPDFQTVCTRRARSNTPLQALTVANDPAFVEFAQGLAARALRELPTDDASARIRRMFVLCLSREPSTREFDVLEKYLQRQTTLLESETARAQSLLTPELVKADAPIPAKAALVLVARAILNTDSFITRE